MSQPNNVVDIVTRQKVPNCQNAFDRLFVHEDEEIERTAKALALSHLQELALDCVHVDELVESIRDIEHCKDGSDMLEAMYSMALVAEKLSNNQGKLIKVVAKLCIRLSDSSCEGKGSF